jgi:hypothetical protein
VSAFWPVVAAAAALAPSYPAALDAASLGGWLSEATGLAPEQVIAVSPSAAIAIVSRGTTPSGTVELRLRAEALTPQAAARAGLLTWEMRLEVDCKGARVRPGETTGYAARTPDDAPVTVAPAAADWRRPVPGTALESAWRAICEPGFRPPLAATLRQVAGPQPKAHELAAPPASPSASASLSPVPAPAAARTGAARNVAAEAPAAAEGARGRRAAQVVSSPVAAETERRLAALRTRFGPQLAGLETRVEPAQVRGRTFYRGLVAGFASHDETAAFCAELKNRGQDCLAR